MAVTWPAQEEDEVNALITGSRAYGTPKPDSDIDLVVMLSQEDLDLLIAFSSGDENPEAYRGATKFSLRFGRLNLLCVTTQEDFEVWRKGTAELASCKPVTRPDAVKLFAALRAELAEQRAANQPQLQLIEEPF